MHKIKIVYSWMGPQGPIPNAELPNILQFSYVSPQADVRSNRFWLDTTWGDLFEKDATFEIAPTFAVGPRDQFIYPFNLGWRIDFTNYFFLGNGIVEFAHVPDHIIHHVREHRGYFLIEMGCEAFVQDYHLQLIHNYFNHLQIPLHKIIYITGCMNAEIIYDSFCGRHGIGKEQHERIKIICMPTSQTGVSWLLRRDDLGPPPKYDTNRMPSRLFLSWNRRYRNHRSFIALSLERLGLIERSFISMPNIDPDTNHISFRQSLDLGLLGSCGIRSKDIDKFVHRLPLVLDGETDTDKMCNDVDNSTRGYYEDSLISLISETNFESQEMTLTEKSFKPIRHKHPFIIAGVRGVLAKLQQLGFETFGEFWDESYDQIEDHWERAKAIADLCMHVGRWDSHQIRQFKTRVKPILEHNYQNAMRDPNVDVCRSIALMIGRD